MKVVYKVLFGQIENLNVDQEVDMRGQLMIVSIAIAEQNTPLAAQIADKRKPS